MVLWTLSRNFSSDNPQTACHRLVVEVDDEVANEHVHALYLGGAGSRDLAAILGDDIVDGAIGGCDSELTIRLHHRIQELAIKGGNASRHIGAFAPQEEVVFHGLAPWVR